MQLFEEINKFFKRTNLEKNIFKLLSMYDQNSENKECLELIDNITLKIKTNICEYQKTFEDSLYNIIDNDFVTLKDLHDEYKKEVYPLFPVKGIALLTTLTNTDISKITNYLSSYLIEEDLNEIKSNLLFQIFKTLSYFEDNNYKEKIKTFLNNNMMTCEHIEAIMTSMKQHKKELKNEGLENEYLNLMAVYFHFLYKSN